MRIRTKMILLLSGMFLLAVLSTGVVYYYQSQQEGDAQVVNLAGRQRMLGIKIAFLAVSVANGDEGLKSELSVALKTYSDSLNTLRSGGIAMGYDIPPAPPEVNANLEACEAVWELYQDKAKIIMETPLNNKPSYQVQEAVSFVKEHAAEVLAANQHLTLAFTDIGSEKVTNLKKILILMLVINATFFSLGIVIALAISKPVHILQTAMSKFAQGNLNQRVEIKAKDEIGQLGASFNQMIGDLKKSREQIELYNPILKQMAGEQRAAHDQLVQASKLATIGQLAVGVSHELNSLLNGSHIGRGSQRCKTIVANLLKFSRASKTQMVPLNIKQVLEETFILTQHQLEINQVELVQEFAPDLPPVAGNEPQLQQVFTNIMLNAQQAMPQGGKLTVSTAINNGLVQIAFADTGCGIPKDRLDKLFDPFFTTKEAGEGIGLGLSVSYGIIQAHGGQIKVESKVGKGTVFRVGLAIKG